MYYDDWLDVILFREKGERLIAYNRKGSFAYYSADLTPMRRIVLRELIRSLDPHRLERMKKV